MAFDYDYFFPGLTEYIERRVRQIGRYHDSLPMPLRELLSHILCEEAREAGLLKPNFRRRN